MSWANEIEQEMKSDKAARDVYGVDMIKTRHEELKAEIDARAETFTTIIQTGEEMINNEHDSKAEVRGSALLMPVHRTRKRAKSLKLGRNKVYFRKVVLKLSKF